MENNLKKINLNKRPLTIIFAVICGILMLLLIVPWCQKHAVNGSTYYTSPLSFSLGLNIPVGLIALVTLISDMFLLMSDFYVIESKHRRIIRIVSVALLFVSILLTIFVAIDVNVIAASR